MTLREFSRRTDTGSDLVSLYITQAGLELTVDCTSSCVRGRQVHGTGWKTSLLGRISRKLVLGSGQCHSGHQGMELTDEVLAISMR